MKLVNFKGEKLFTPGPVELPEPVRLALSRQIIHHRTPEFTQAFLETRELFKRLVDEPTENFVFFASSGTGAMEAAVLNFFNEGDEVVVIEAGKFGQRWTELALRWGLKPKVVRPGWGKALKLEQLERALKETPNARGLLFQISESSTGAFYDPRKFKELLKDREILVVADAITALGVYDLKPSEWGVDVLVGGSQKALMLPPGLSILWFSERARERLTDRAYYFSVKNELPKQTEGQTAFTPAVPLVLALKESLELILAAGRQALERKHLLMAEGTRRAFESLGFRLFPEEPAASLGAFVPPEGLPADAVRKKLLEKGIRVAGGQGELKGKIVRVSYMGVDPLELMQLLGALELTLYELTGRPPTGEPTGHYLSALAS
ncbi:MAG: alanine--glyoxylate aminotransferase family protein [Aquificae bacterium]|nr:alanine--glyoxylate aminotransferase family protein [Aquificota bacterium]